MSLIYTYDGGALSHKVEPSGISLPQRADMGEASFGGIPIEDPGATLTLLGHRPFIVEEDDCDPPRLWTGWVTERGIGRSLDRGMFVGANPRLHDTTIVDCNAAFGFRMIKGTDGNRPEETWDARLAWLLASNYLAGTSGALVEDTGYLMTSTVPMDAADYRGGYPASVLDDLAARFEGRVNYFAWWDPTASKVSLFFKTIDAVTGDCGLRISNVETDIDSTTTFAPDSVASLAREPDQVYSEVIVEYANGSVFRTRPSTAETHIRRGTKINRPYIGKAETAQLAAEQFLDAHATETDRITCSIQVPSASVGLIRAGQRISVKFSHMPGYEAFTWMRIVMCSPVPTDDTGYWYNVGLELVAPKPEPEYEPMVAEVHFSDHGCAADEHAYPKYLRWQYTGDAPKSGWFPNPLQGALAYEPCSYVGGTYIGIRSLGTGTVDVHHGGEFAGVAASAGTFTVQIRLNGASIAEYVWTDPAPGGLHYVGGTVTLDATDVAVVADDIFTVWVSYSGIAFFYYRPNASAPQTQSQLIVSGAGYAIAPDTLEDLGSSAGTVIVRETPAPDPDGVFTSFSTYRSYKSGSLRVAVDGIPIPVSEVTETDPAAGQFTLSWAPDADELITCTYIVGP